MGRIAGLFKKGGVCALAEVVPSDGQRLSAFDSSWEGEQKIVGVLRSAEKILFSDPDDPMVSWSVTTLEQSLSTLDDCTVGVALESATAMRRIAAGH